MRKLKPCALIRDGITTHFSTPFFLTTSGVICILGDTVIDPKLFTKEKKYRNVKKK